MKMEKINENKIKVTISVSDLEERNIDINALNYNSPAAQELFWDMMEQAEIEFGFDTSDAQLCIEAYPDIEEGFTITITKLDEDGEFESIQKYIKSKYSKKELRSKKKGRKVCSSLLMYAFNDFDDLCMLGKKVQPLYCGESTLYKCKTTYYLLLSRSGVTTSNIKMFENILSEYGTKISNIAFYEGYLSEYGQKIMQDNALELIEKFF